MSITDVTADQSHKTETSSPLTPATRHLCAGAMIDRSFRDRVIRVHNASQQRIAPSYEFDLVPVMRSAWAALFLEAAGHTALLAAVTLPVAMGRTWSAVLVACALIVWTVVHAEVRRTRSVLRRAAEESDRKRMDTWKRRFGRLSALRPAPLLDRPITGVARLVPLRFRRYASGGLAVALFVGGSYVLRPADTEFAGSIAACLVAAMAAFGVTRQLRINRLYKDSPPPPRRLTHRERSVRDQQDHPCVVYRRTDLSEADEDDGLPLSIAPFGNTSPFVGAGEIVHLWNPPMTVQMLRPDEGGQSTQEREWERPPFRAHELVDHLRQSMRKLDRDSEDVRLRGIVGDRVFVCDSDVSADRALLDRATAAREINRIIDAPGHTGHHFLEVCVPSAGGELVTTVLLRVSLQGRTLSLDFAACVLTRTPEPFRKFDLYAEHGAFALAIAALRAVRDIPLELARIYRLLKLPVAAVRWFLAQQERTLRPRKGVQIGSTTSIRESCAEPWGEVQLDKNTILRHMKIVEEHLLNSVHDFLESHGIDTEAFRKRATNILTASVINVGGTNQFTNSAIGAQAQASNVQVQTGGAPAATA